MIFIKGKKRVHTIGISDIGPPLHTDLQNMVYLKRFDSLTI